MPGTIKQVSHPPKLARKTQVAAYARVSSGKDSMLHSLSAQVSYYSNLIQAHDGWEYVGVYADEAVTGTKECRNDFQRMLTDCRAGKIDRILTKSISRFARNTVTLLTTVRELKTLGVDIFFEKKDFDTAESPILRDFSALYRSLWCLVGVQICVTIQYDTLSITEQSLNQPQILLEEFHQLLNNALLLSRPIPATEA